MAAALRDGSGGSCQRERRLREGVPSECSSGGREESRSFRQTPAWSELAVVFGLLSVGEIFFGHFKKERPKPLGVVTVRVRGEAPGGLVSATAGAGSLR